MQLLAFLKLNFCLYLYLTILIPFHLSKRINETGRESSKLKMKNRDEKYRGSRWTEEKALKAFEDRFGLPRKELLFKPLTRVRMIRL